MEVPPTTTTYELMQVIVSQNIVLSFVLFVYCAVIGVNFVTSVLRAIYNVYTVIPRHVAFLALKDARQFGDALRQALDENATVKTTQPPCYKDAVHQGVSTDRWQDLSRANQDIENGLEWEDANETLQAEISTMQSTEPCRVTTTDAFVQTMAARLPLLWESVVSSASTRATAVKAKKTEVRSEDPYAAFEDPSSPTHAANWLDNDLQNWTRASPLLTSVSTAFDCYKPSVKRQDSTDIIPAEEVQKLKETVRENRDDALYNDNFPPLPPAADHNGIQAFLPIPKFTKKDRIKLQKKAVARQYPVDKKTGHLDIPEPPVTKQYAEKNCGLQFGTVDEIPRSPTHDASPEPEQDAETKQGVECEPAATRTSTPDSQTAVKSAEPIQNESGKEATPPLAPQREKRRPRRNFAPYWEPYEEEAGNSFEFNHEVRSATRRWERPGINASQTRSRESRPTAKTPPRHHGGRYRPPPEFYEAYSPRHQRSSYGRQRRLHSRDHYDNYF